MSILEWLRVSMEKTRPPEGEPDDNPILYYGMLVSALLFFSPLLVYCYVKNKIWKL